MVPKRPFRDDGGDGRGYPGGEEYSKRFKSAIRDVMGRLTLHDFASRMEPFIRDVIRDEVQQTLARVLNQNPRPSFHQADASGGCGFWLQFVGKLPEIIFTGSRIGADDDGPVRVMLIDSTTRTRVKSGPLSSMKVEAVVLDGNFGSDDQEHWSQDDFSASIIRERDGRRPLVTGDLTISLRDGVGEITNVVFTDNSSWQRNGRFKLGVRVAQRIPDDLRIREARSGAFRVKDHRGELYKKHYPPQLEDQVWRLEKIAKDGACHTRLASRGIHTVKDFLRLYATDPRGLRAALGDGISKRTWETITRHATTCVPNDGKLYYYHDPGQTTGLFLNSVYNIVGAALGGQNYKQLDELTSTQRLSVENLKRQAYQNVDKLVEVDTHAVFGPPRPLTILQSETFHGQNLVSQLVDNPATRQDQPELQFDFNTPTGSGSFTCDAESSSQLQVSVPQNILGQNSDPMKVLPGMFRGSFKLGDVFTLPAYPGETSWSPGSLQWPVATSSQSTGEEEIGQVQTSNWPGLNSTWGQGNTFLLASGNEEELGLTSFHPSLGIQMSRIRKPKAGWCKLRAAFRWGSVRRDIAAKRLWQGYYCM